MASKMANPAMNNIKRKIQALKEEVEIKDEEIDNLKEKLKQSNDQIEIAEAEAKASERKYTLMEEKLDQTEEKLDQIKKLFEEVETDRDEKERELRKYMNTDETTSTALEQQSYELKEAKDIAQMADYKYEEIARRLVVLTTELELAEKRCEEAEAKAEESSRMMQLALRCVHSQKQSLEKLCDLEASSEEQISLLQEKLSKVETQYEEKLKESEKLTKDVEDLEDDLFDLRLSYVQLKARRSTPENL